MSSFKALSGSHEGAVFVLAKGDNSIGRDPSSRICLHDLGVSLHHGTVVLEGDHVIIRDEDSRNGIAVNGEKVRESALEDGDTLLFGSSLLQFCELDGNGAPADEQFETVKISLNPDELNQLLTSRPDYSVGSIGPGGSEALCRLAVLLTSEDSPTRLLDDSIRCIGDYLSADSGFACLIETRTDALKKTIEFGSEQSSGSDGFSENATREVLQTGQSIVLEEGLLNGTLRQTESVAAMSGCSVIYAPMLTKGVIGFVRRGPGEFQSEDLRFAALSAHLVAMALTTLEEKEIAISRSMELEAIFRGQFEIVGQSAMIREVFQTIERVAPNDTPVLVTGETGTGKELVANAIHANGPRSSKPYIPVNCAALPNSLLDSSLFGFVKGAFTGADKDTKGCFEKAHEGTLFLDEVAELTINAQAKLLRVLEDGVVQRIGDDSHILVDVRLIFATHRDLEEEVREKRFREDLFYRLNVIKLHLPPLRERTSDIPLLAEHFFRQSLMKSERVIEGFSDEALEFLQDYPWPGNVRELHNAILRAVILGRGNLLEPSDFGLSENQPISSPPWPVESTMKEIERDHVRQVLISVGWKKIDAARILQIDRKTLASKCKEYGLDKGGAT